MPCKPSLRAPCYLSRPPLALPLFDWGLTRQVILPTQNPASESARRDAHLRLRSCSGRCSLAPPSPPAPRHPSSASKMPLPATATRPPDKTRSAPVVPIQPLPGGSGGGGGESGISLEILLVYVHQYSALATVGTCHTKPCNKPNSNMHDNMSEVWPHVSSMAWPTLKGGELACQTNY